MAAAQWDLDGTVNIVAAAGDHDLSDVADTWWIISAEGWVFSLCYSSGPLSVVAGEPFLVNDDTECDF